jgi:hypothetical protein
MKKIQGLAKTIRQLLGGANSPERRGIRRTLTAAQVSSTTSVEAFRLAQAYFFSSHPWFFGPFPV